MSEKVRTFAADYMWTIGSRVLLFRKIIHSINGVRANIGSVESCFTVSKLSRFSPLLLMLVAHGHALLFLMPTTPKMICYE